ALVCKQVIDDLHCRLCRRRLIAVHVVAQPYGRRQLGSELLHLLLLKLSRIAQARRIGLDPIYGSKIFWTADNEQVQPAALIGAAILDHLHPLRDLGQPPIVAHDVAIMGKPLSNAMSDYLFGLWHIVGILRVRIEGEFLGLRRKVSESKGKHHQYYET